MDGTFTFAYWANPSQQGFSYLFDIFLGASYNQVPPSVKYMTVNLIHIT